VYLILFLKKQKIVLPDFLFKENLELKSILKKLLDEFYNNFSQYFNNNIRNFLKEYY
jgi:hypothetical protein